jgi:hypothetical protein
MQDPPRKPTVRQTASRPGNAWLHQPEPPISGCSILPAAPRREGSGIPRIWWRQRESDWRRSAGPGKLRQVRQITKLCIAKYKSSSSPRTPPPLQSPAPSPLLLTHSHISHHHPSPGQCSNDCPNVSHLFWLPPSYLRQNFIFLRQSSQPSRVPPLQAWPAVIPAL